ncbi:hypothetical protein [Sphaerisporangium perillae]|uniref:hypothetical protein n=1 Tax=Sphaerisporangium perillae TaxID=2935860 RepID=UPI00200D3D18|nr:hypothetical protein [Sphaerisporangium perillae]
MRRVGLLVIPGFALLSGCGAAVTLGPAQFDTLRSQGVSPDLVYVVDLPGYELAKESVSVYNDEGFQTYYISAEGRQLWFGVDRGAFSDALCQVRPLHDAEALDAPVSCERDDVGWYRTSGEHHEYVAMEDDHVLRLGGLREDVERVALKEAMASARHAFHAGTPSAPATPADPSSAPAPRTGLPPPGDAR